MKALSQFLQHPGCLAFLLAAMLSSCMTTWVAFGDLQLKDAAGRPIWGEYMIDGAHPDRMQERWLRIRFFANNASKLTVIFEEKHMVMTDSTDVDRRSQNDARRQDVVIKNRNGTVAFHRAYHFAKGNAATMIVSSDPNR